MVKKHSLSQRTSGSNFLEFEVMVDRKKGTPEVAYIHLNERKSEYTKPYGKHGEVLVDFDKNDEPVGIELLEPAKTTVTIMRKITKQLNISTPRAIYNLQRSFAY
ncbi:MAG: DUF2283 domain-containing protein [Fibrobacterota bacterium]